MDALVLLSDLHPVVTRLQGLPVPLPLHGGGWLACDHRLKLDGFAGLKLRSNSLINLDLHYS